MNNTPIVLFLVAALAGCATQEVRVEREHTGIVGGRPDLKIIYDIAPEYPLELRNKKIQGVVVVRLYIREDGSVITPLIISSPHPAFSASVLAAVEKWRFSPARPKEKRGLVQIEIPLTFQFRGSKPMKKPNQAPEPTAPSGRGSP
jgi:TonB family protein